MKADEWPCGPVPEGRRWLTPVECHGNGAYCTRCSPRNPTRATITTVAPEVRLTLTRGGVVTSGGFGRVLDPGDTYTTTAPADLTIQ